MTEFLTVARLGEIPAGEGKTILVNGRLIALFREGESYFAIDDTCPHQGASLGAGYVQDGAVYCPWHAWRFCVKEGTWLDSPKSKIRCGTYDVRIQGEEIQVRLPSPEKSDPPAGTE